jgi:hypothetical protein
MQGICEKPKCKYIYIYMSFIFTVHTECVEKTLEIFHRKLNRGAAKKQGQGNSYMTVLKYKQKGQILPPPTDPAGPFPPTSKTTFAKITATTLKPRLASFKFTYGFPRYKKQTHSSGQSLVLPAATDIAEAVLGGSCDKEIQKAPIANNKVERRIPDISEE